MAKLSDRGELQLVEQIIDSLPAAARPGEGPGDDAAVVYLDSGPPVLLCIDTITEGVHFRRDISSAYDIGWKAVAVNLSDIAAMGGLPSRLVIAICAPGDTGADDLQEIVRGADACARAFGATIAGGDTTESPVLSVTAAALGRMPEGVEPVLRTGARSGDVVFVTGRLGEAALGLEAAVAGADVESSAVLRHRRPSPRVREGVKAARSGATSMIDISDGLVLDASRLADASRKKLTIDLIRIPVLAEAEVSDGRPASGGHLVPEEHTGPPEKPVASRSLSAALTGGEDFELLFTVGRDLAAALLEEWGDDLVAIGAIGEVSEGSGVELVPPESVPKEVGAGGWEHFGRAGRF